MFAGLSGIVTYLSWVSNFFLIFDKRLRYVISIVFVRLLGLFITRAQCLSMSAIWYFMFYGNSFARLRETVTSLEFTISVRL